VLAAFAGSLVTAAVLLLFRDDKGPSSSSATGVTPTTAPLAPGQTRPPTAAGTELTRLIDAGRSQTFHARYAATSTDPATAGSQVTLDLWRKPPKEREELVQSSGGRTVRSAGFLLPPLSVLCRQTDPSAPWACANTPQTQADDLLKGVTGEVAGQAAGARDDTVASRPVRCFGVPGDQPSELCLTAQGITARLTTGASKIELVDLSFDVSDDVFTPPATPTG
jgi:hypothetical protein